MAQTSPEPMLLDITGAKDCFLFDSENRAYLDLISGVSVSNLGHQNKRIIKAVNSQMNIYSHIMVYGEFVQDIQVSFAKLILEQLPPDFENVYFVNSGAEAIEGAIKLARKYTQRKKIISFKDAYHGSTTGALSLMSSADFTEPFKPLLPEVKHITWNDEAALSLIDESTAAVFAEVVRGESGYELASGGYLKKLRQRCTEVGSLLIFDEIQSGMGRTGTFCAFEQEAVIPDVVCLAKALGGGLPLGAFISSKEIMQSLMHDPVLGHITTFGGNAVCCAAGKSALEQVTEIIKDQSIFRKEQIFRDLLKHDRIVDVSGKGFMLAVQFESAKINQKVISNCLKKGVLVDWFLFAPHKLRIAPPLIISDSEIVNACETIIFATTKL